MRAWRHISVDRHSVDRPMEEYAGHIFFLLSDFRSPTL